MSYLRRRPRCECRALFLRVTAPRQGLNRCTVAWVVRAACDRAGLPRVGAHRLRHTAATQMLQAGASLPEIGQVLRHREQKTTAIYAKVDRAALRALARPWPRRAVCHERAARGVGGLPAHPSPARLRDAPGRATARGVRRVPRAGRRAADHDRVGAGVGAAARRRAPVHVAPAAHGCARFRPVPGHDRSGQRGPIHGPVAGASPADRPLRLLRGGDRGADGRRDDSCGRRCAQRVTRR